MKRIVSSGSLALAIVSMCCATPGAAEEHHKRHHRHHSEGHGDCLRFNKTTGAVAGAGVGGVVGNAVIGGPGGFLVGAAGGGLAGHSLANNNRKRCH